MRVYENLLAFSPSKTPEDRKGHEKELEKLIEKHSGKVLQKTEIGQRPLGYQVQKHREAYLVLWEVQMDPASATDYRRALQLYPNLLKFMVTQKVERKKPAKPRKAPRRRPESETETRSHTAGKV